MIFVTLGTQDKSFVRLLNELELLKNAGKIKHDVVVQAGYTKFKTKNMEIFDFLSSDDFDKYVKKCDILITHGGVGSILSGLKNNKKVIAIPRLKKYREHTNDHQLQIIKKFDKLHYIVGINDVKQLEFAIEKTKKFVPQNFSFDNSKIINILTNYINSN